MEMAATDAGVDAGELRCAVAEVALVPAFDPDADQFRPERAHLRHQFPDDDDAGQGGGVCAGVYGAKCQRGAILGRCSGGAGRADD